MGINYFPHDANARNSDKLLRVRMKHGAAGYGVFFMLLEWLRDSENYTSVKDYNMIAFGLRVDASLVKSVIEDFGLFAFTEDGECFYSESLTGRLGIMDESRNKRSEAAKKAAESRWSKDNDANAMQTQCDGNADAMQEQCDLMPNKNKTKIKEKKNPTKVGEKEKAAKAASLAQRKEKLRVEIYAFEGLYPKAMLDKFFDYWTEENKSGTQMRYDKQPTWETKKRLKTWADREGFDNKPSTVLRDNGTDKYDNQQLW